MEQVSTRKNNERRELASSHMRICCSCFSLLLVGSRSESQLIAALGVGWSHAVNTRILLEMVDDGRRVLRIAKSPMFPYQTHVYEIAEDGATIITPVGHIARPTAIVAVSRAHHSFAPFFFTARRFSCRRCPRSRWIRSQHVNG